MSAAPYPGLRPFARDEVDIFFGREEHADELLARLGQHHFLAVLGPSGYGKSSLLRTGLLAGLESGFLAGAGARWRLVEMRPGHRPFAALAENLLEAMGDTYRAHFRDPAQALAFLQADLRRGPYSLRDVLEDTPLPPDCNLLILIDQFEEVFRHYNEISPDEAAAFVSLLLTAAEHPLVYVVIALRSEFLGECAVFHGLPEAINQGLYLVPRLTREQLQEAVCGPAEVFGALAEPELVNQLLNDAGGDPDQLPLIQHVLQRMWDWQPEPRPLRLADYLAFGGLRQALSQHADEAYQELDAGQQRIAEILFRALCESIAGHRDLRHPASLSAVARLAGVEWQEVAAVADKFRQPGRGFLLPRWPAPLSPDSLLDITHESLIRQWARLRRWARSETESAALYRRLEDSAQRWQAGQAALLQPPELETALAWRDRFQPGADWAARYSSGQAAALFPLTLRYLDASHAAKAAHDRAIEEARQDKLRRMNLQRKTAGIGTVIALLLAWWAWEAEKIAQEQAALAETQRKAAQVSEQHAVESEERRTVNLFDSHLTHATLLARVYDFSAATTALQQTRELEPKIAPARLHSRNLLAGYAELRGGSSEQSYRGAGIGLYTLALTPAGDVLAAGNKNGLVELFDSSSGELRQTLRGHSGGVFSLAADPLGRWIFSAGKDGKIIRWSVASSEKLSEWDNGEKVLTLAVSPDGKILASGGGDAQIVLRDSETGAVLNRLIGHSRQLAFNGLAFSPDGALLASGAMDQKVLVWEVASGKIRYELSGHAEGVQSVSFSRDGKLLASAGNDGKIVLWNTTRGHRVREWNGHEGKIYALRFSPDSKLLISSGNDGSVRLWEAATGSLLRVLQGHSAGVMDLMPWGGVIFSASLDGSLRRWNVALPGQQLLEVPDEPLSVAQSPDGRWLAVGFKNGDLSLYRVETGGLLWELAAAHQHSVARLAFSPDGKLLASAGGDKATRLWQLQADSSQVSLKPLRGNPYPDVPVALAFSPDGKRLAVALQNGEAALGSVETGQATVFAAHQGKASAVAFSPDGMQLLTAGRLDSTLKRWEIQAMPPRLAQEIKLSEMPEWVEWSPAGDLIAVAGEAGGIQVMTRDGNASYKLEGHENPVYRVFFSPDGQQLASASMDATVKLWDIAQRERLFNLRLPAPAGWPPPLLDFDFRCFAGQFCRAAVPLANGRVALYALPYAGWDGR
jgi:WD40 repeat protein